MTTFQSECISDSLTLDAKLNPASMLSNAELAKQTRAMINALESYGASIHPSSRLHRYAKLFESSDDLSKLDVDLAMLEVLQFQAILRALLASGSPRQWIPALASAAGGSVSSHDDQCGSRARSDQFELFAMANLALAGFEVECAEPDLRVRIGATSVAVAAKRLRSERKLDRNLSDAQRQLVRHGTAGFIVVDLSFLNTVQKPIYLPRLEQQQVLSQIFADAFMVKHERSLYRVATHPCVLGVLLHASVVGRSIEPVSRYVSRRWLLYVTRHSPASRRLASAIQELGRKWQPPLDLEAD